MITRFQYDTVVRLYNSGVRNYVQLRQQAGLTAEELDDILDNMEYYAEKFTQADREEMLARLNRVNTPWWKKIFRGEGK